MTDSTRPPLLQDLRFWIPTSFLAFALLAVPMAYLLGLAVGRIQIEDEKKETLRFLARELKLTPMDPKVIDHRKLKEQYGHLLP